MAQCGFLSGRHHTVSPVACLVHPSAEGLSKSAQAPSTAESGYWGVMCHDPAAPAFSFVLCRPVVTEVPTFGLMWDSLGDGPYEAPGVVWSTESTQRLLAIFRTITEDKFPIHGEELANAPVTVASASPHNMGPNGPLD